MKTKTTRLPDVTLADLLPDRPGQFPPSATVGVVPKCQKDYPGFDQELLIELLNANSTADKITAEEDSPDWKAAMKEYHRRTDDVLFAVDLMLLDAFQKGRAAQSAQRAIVEAAQPAPELTKATSDDPAFQEYLDTMEVALKKWVATMPPTPARDLPVLNKKVEAFAFATDRLHRAPDKGQEAREAFRAVAEAEAALYSFVDELRQAARDFGKWNALRTACPAVPAGTPAASVSAPVAPIAPVVLAFGAAPCGGVHALLNHTLQTLRYDDLFAAAQEEAVQWNAAVLAGSADGPDATAHQEVYHAARKSVRAAVVQFGSQAYLAGLEAGKEPKKPAA